MTYLAVACLACYLAGSFPTALLMGRVIGKVDIREHGSGNAGATNVYRLFGLKPYIATLAVDIFKGYAAAALIAPYGAGALSEQRTAMLCGVFAVVGHVWTVFAGFRGGKGVATAGGVILGIVPLAAVAALGVYLLVTLGTGYVSLGSMSAAVSAPVFIFFLEPGAPPELLGITAALALFIVYTHRSNIGRLLKGEERRTDFLSRRKGGKER